MERLSLRSLLVPWLEFINEDSEAESRGIWQSKMGRQAKLIVSLGS